MTLREGKQLNGNIFIYFSSSVQITIVQITTKYQKSHNELMYFILSPLSITTEIDFKSTKKKADKYF